MTGKTDKPADTPLPIDSVDDFLMHAYVIEQEASERYEDLAYQMDKHNNKETARLFHQLAHAEAKHLAEIASRLEGRKAVARAPWEYQWQGVESPEAADLWDIHYLMTPYHALEIALRGEQRAFEFFDTIAKQYGDGDIRTLAAEMAEEERGHIHMVEKALAAALIPPENWKEDPDPPVAVD